MQSPGKPHDFDWFWYGLTLIIPLAGPFVAIWWLAHDRVGPGLAVLLTAWVSAALWFLILFAVGLANT
jgi:hypothetical protein